MKSMKLVTGVGIDETVVYEARYPDDFRPPSWVDKGVAAGEYRLVVTDCSSAVAAEKVEAKRASGYPPLADLADALVHQFAGDGGAKLNEYLAKCVAVKLANPKPSESK